MASGVSDEPKLKPRRKPPRSKELLDPQGKPDLVSKLKELGTKRKKMLDRKAPVTLQNPPMTFRVEASSVLSRAKCFLPEMESADQDLRVLLKGSQSNRDLDIENTEDGGPCIEMNVAVVPMVASDEGTSGSSSDSSSEGEGDQSDYLPLKVSDRHKKRTFLIEEVT